MEKRETAPLTRRELLLAQYDTSYEVLAERLAGLTDAEYVWEPVSGCWSIRRREATVTSHPIGSGAWVLDYERVFLIV